MQLMIRPSTRKFRPGHKGMNALPKTTLKRGREDEGGSEPATKRQTRSASGIKVQTFATWFPVTGGRSTPITYGSLKPDGGGGTMAWAFLRVRDFVDINTNAMASLPPGIKEAREKYPGKHFKAGHLLNAAFGGPGNKPKNLTILSASGNSRHKRFDNNIKEAFRLLTKAYEALCSMGLPPDQAALCVMIKVRAKGAWDDEELPDRLICTHLSCKAQLLGQSDVASAIKALPVEPGPALMSTYFGLINGAEIAMSTALKIIPNP